MKTVTVNIPKEVLVRASFSSAWNVFRCARFNLVLLQQNNLREQRPLQSGKIFAW